MSRRERGIGRLVLEGVVVVASILVAFVLDAWWDGREAQQQLDQELASVGREADGNRELVAYEINSLERIIAGSETAAELLGAPEGRIVPVPDTLVWFVAFWSPTLDVSFGALDALIASGRLAQIEDVDLRLGLAGLRARVEDALGDELLAQSILMEQIHPAVSRATDLAPVFRIDRAYFAEERQVDRPAPTEDAALMLQSSFQLSNAILNRASWLGSSLGEMRRLLSHLEDLSAMIERDVP